jgi:hypothetical protein
MLVLTVFISICTVAVLFLLRFLFALESEFKSARKPLAERVSRISTFRISSGAGARDSGPVLTLVHSSSGLFSRESLESDSLLFQREQKSQFKRA